MVHVNVWLAVFCALSRTVAVTEKVPAVVGVPEMTPLDALIDRPAGSPGAEKGYGGVPPEAERGGLGAGATGPVWVPGVARASVGPPARGGSPAWGRRLAAVHA